MGEGEVCYLLTYPFDHRVLVEKDVFLEFVLVDMIHDGFSPASMERGL